MKKLLVFFMVLVGVVFVANTIAAAELAKDPITVEVNGIDASDNPSIVVGEKIFVRVEFEADANVQDVTIEAELEGDRKDVKAETSLFDVEADKKYTKTLVLEVPFDLKDTLSGDVDLHIEISGNDGYKTSDSYTLRVQRESYSIEIMSVEVPQTVNAGESFQIDIVLKNRGYNDVDDLFVTAKISALGIERTAFFGDIVALRCDDEKDAEKNWGINISRKCWEDERDTVTGTISLQMPYDAEPGVYALEVEVENDDTVSSKAVQLVTKNSFPDGNFIVSDGKLLIVNPTNEIMVYRLVPQSTDDVSVTLSETLVSVAAGSSKTVTVDAESDIAGTHTYSVSIFGMDGNLVKTVSFTKTIGGQVTSPIVVLTIVLAIIFIVLLVVLIVLLGKKPEKTEEFSESYY